MTLQLHDNLHHLSTHQLSRLTHNFARVNWRPGLTLKAIIFTSLACLPAYTTLDLVWLLWSLGKLQYSTSASKKLMKDSLALLVDSLQQQDQQQTLSSIDIASLLWSCARINYRNDLLLEPLLDVLMARHSFYQQKQEQAPGPDARTVSNVVWACAKLGLQHRQLQEWAQATDLSQANAQAVSNIIWGLWKLGGFRALMPMMHACRPVQA